MMLAASPFRHYPAVDNRSGVLRREYSPEILAGPPVSRDATMRSCIMQCQAEAAFKAIYGCTCAWAAPKIAIAWSRAAMLPQCILGEPATDPTAHKWPMALAAPFWPWHALHACDQCCHMLTVMDLRGVHAGCAQMAYLAGDASGEIWAEFQ